MDWDSIASNVGGKLVRGSWHGWVGTGRATIEVRRGGVLVDIKVGVNRFNEEHVECSVDAPYLLPVGPQFRLLPQGTMRMWLRQFGYQDIEPSGGPLSRRPAELGRARSVD